MDKATPQSSLEFSTNKSTCACGIEISQGQKFQARDKIFVLIIFAMTFGGIAGLQFLRTSPGIAASAAAPTATSTSRPLDISQIRGMALQLQSGDDGPDFAKYVREIAATGANSICLVVAASQQNCGSSSIFMDTRKTPSAKRMKELIDLSHELGMKVILMPIVLLENAREGEWRGKIDPTMDKNTWEDWWEDYTNYIMYYANLASQDKVDIFMVGSELVSVEKQTDQWVKLIEQVRGAYSGYLSYSSNWDHYKPIKFWDKLDIVGMTTYYDLCGDKSPTLDVMLETWAGIKKDLLEWQATVGRPILFTEVGWPNQETAAKYPWDYYRATDKPAPELQKTCFESFFKTWADEKTIAGYVVWEWRNWDMPTDPRHDTSFCPMDKPALALIEEYFHRSNGLLTGGSMKLPQPASKPADAQSGQPVVHLEGSAAEVE